MPPFALFICGVLVGTVVGVFIMALLAVSRTGEA